MTAMTITHQDDGNSGRYVADLAGEKASGHLDWEAQGENVRVATHTIVPPEIGGRGVAAKLVEALVADAREQHFKIDPRCSYVAKKFDENPEWSDLRA